ADQLVANDGEQRVGWGRIRSSVHGRLLVLVGTVDATVLLPARRLPFQNVRIYCHATPGLAANSDTEFGRESRQRIWPLRWMAAHPTGRWGGIASGRSWRTGPVSGAGRPFVRYTIRSPRMASSVNSVASTRQNSRPDSSATTQRRST